MTSFSRFFLPALLLLGACAGTNYVGYGDATDGPEFPSRTVAFEFGQKFYAEMPDCALIMPPATEEGLEVYAAVVEESLSRHMAMKFTRIIGPVERDIMAREMSIDLDRADDRRALAEGLGCETFVLTKINEPGADYLLVWSRVHVGLDVRMEYVYDQSMLWQSRHVAARSGGGLPLSPLGIIVNGFQAGRFAADESDIVASVIDDAVRRMVASLPDARIFRTVKETRSQQ